MYLSNYYEPSPVDPNSYKLNAAINEVDSERAKEWPVQPIFRTPTENNPFSNVPITAFGQPQVYSDYTRMNLGPASKFVKNSMEDNFIKTLYQNPGDKLFERNNSQRQFYSVPVGSVPNNQEAFAESLYGKAYVCKAGSIDMRYGVKYTPDSLTCTGFDSSSPTNFGQLYQNQN